MGTGGPSCAREHHRAFGEEAIDWRDGQWAGRAGGSGRELVWFPEPVGGRDCYRAGLCDALLLVPAFAGVQRVTARVAATRRDRVTAPWPMLRPPHPEGEVGAVRVEVRGRRGEGREVVVLGGIDRPAVAAGAVAAVSVLWAIGGGLRGPGAGGLASLLPEPGPFLAELARRRRESRPSSRGPDRPDGVRWEPRASGGGVGPGGRMVGAVPRGSRPLARRHFRRMWRGKRSTWLRRPGGRAAGAIFAPGDAIIAESTQEARKMGHRARKSRHSPGVGADAPCHSGLQRRAGREATRRPGD